MIKAIYDKYDARPGTSNFFGKIYVHDFTYPPVTSKFTSTIVVMYEVLRQDNPEFLSLLKNL